MKVIKKDGVTFYLDRIPVVCGRMGMCVCDIHVDPGVTRVAFDLEKHDAHVVDLLQVRKQFPDVTELEIGHGMGKIQISNYMFPNVKKVTSKTIDYQDGASCLINHQTLLNTFCKKADEELELSDISIIANCALDGCRTENIRIKNDNIDVMNPKGFIGHLKPHNVCIFNGVLTDVERYADEIYLTKGIAINRCVFRDIKKITFEDPKMLSDANNRMENVREIHIGDGLMPTNLDGLNAQRITAQSQYYKDIDGILYTADGKTLICCPKYREGNVKVPEGVTHIAKLAFNHCNVSGIELPDTLKSIDDYAFANCKNLKKIDFGKGIQRIMGENILQISAKNARTLSVTLPPQLKVIGANAFRNSFLSSVELNDGLEMIMDSAFLHNPALHEITIPGSVKYLGCDVFSDVSHIHIDGNKLPDGFMKAISSITIEQFEPLKVTLKNDRVFFIPNGMIFSSETEFQAETFMNFSSLYTYTKDPIGKQAAAISTYQATGDIDAKNYLKRSSRNIIQNWVDGKREKELVEFLKLGLTSDKTLKWALGLAQKRDMPCLASYIMSMQKKGDTFRL